MEEKEVTYVDQVDTERMKRVLERVYPGADRESPRYQLPVLPIPEPVGEKRREETPSETSGERTLLDGEMNVQRIMCILMDKSQVCRRILQEPVRQCRIRAQILRTEWFLRTGETVPLPKTPPRRGPGVLSLLRQVHERLEALAEGYESMIWETPRREMYGAMGAECRAAAGTVRDLLKKAMQ